MFTYRAELTRVVDGDTLDLRVDLGFRVRLDARVRLAGVDAPETRGPQRDEGKKAKEFVEEWFRNLGGRVVIQTAKDPRDKYGRWLATVYPAMPDPHEGAPPSLSESIIRAGLGRKSPW